MTIMITRLSELDQRTCQRHTHETRCEYFATRFFEMQDDDTESLVPARDSALLCGPHLAIATIEATALG